ncbi:Pinin, variant 3 [Clonorchis sinensis]|uniref:Pinin n=1 Tax=Clonorchis sinensis TaxID=79923 RepID=A0A8T1LZD9_CLOSI|nr:Pinin, variant 2 [Clonorchis sinensis]KAG5442313.1 Pinin, variant 3 [Clonorchis sinensis]
MTAVEAIDVLRQNLELAKEQLKNVDEDIRKMTGRDPVDDRFPRRPVETGYRRPEVNKDFKLPGLRPTQVAVAKEELARIPEEDLQVSLASSVVRVAESRSRSDATKEMRKSDRDRGRRMLGILQGTLNQFRAESAAAIFKPQMAKRLQVDKKLEARAEEERQKLRRERAQLFRARREQQMEVALLQQKMRLLKGFELWKTEMEKMIGFCRTETSPHIFFRPKIHNEESRRRVLETEEVINDIIRHRRRKIDIGFEESAILRRRQFVSQTDKDMDSDHDESTEQRSPRDWSPPRKISTSKSSEFSTGKARQPGSVVNRITASGKRRQTSGAQMDTGELSDTSETFAIEGDEEPQLMEEEHTTVMTTTHSGLSVSSFLVNNTGNTVRSKDRQFEEDSLTSKSDTRTVRMDDPSTEDTTMTDAAF